MNVETSVLMADINERAVELSEKNLKQNGIKNGDVCQSDGFSQLTGPFDTIVCNPPIRAGKSIIYPIFEQCVDYLVPGGALYIVIQKKQGANSAVSKLTSMYGNCDVLNKEEGYWILRSKKPLS